MYYYTLHRGTKHFYRYCLQDFRTPETLTCHIKDRINSKQRIKMAKQS